MTTVDSNSAFALTVQWLAHWNVGWWNWMIMNRLLVYFIFTLRADFQVRTQHLQFLRYWLSWNLHPQMYCNLSGWCIMWFEYSHNLFLHQRVRSRNIMSNKLCCNNGLWHLSEPWLKSLGWSSGHIGVQQCDWALERGWVWLWWSRHCRMFA